MRFDLHHARGGHEPVALQLTVGRQFALLQLQGMLGLNNLPVQRSYLFIGFSFLIGQQHGLAGERTASRVEQRALFDKKTYKVGVDFGRSHDVGWKRWRCGLHLL